MAEGGGDVETRAPTCRELFGNSHLVDNGVQYEQTGKCFSEVFSDAL